MPTISEVFAAYIKSYETGKQGEIAKYLHPRHTYYAPGGCGAFDLKARLDDEHYFFDGFSEIQTSIDDELVDGQRLAARITMTCRHTGSYQGVEATGKMIRIPYMEVLHFKDGLILDEWAEFDMMSILNQLKS